MQCGNISVGVINIQIKPITSGTIIDGCLGEGDFRFRHNYSTNLCLPKLFIVFKDSK